MMIEVPAAALAAELFDVDFYSIGTNDLIQYATACARDNRDVAALARGDHPGVLRMIDAVVTAGETRGSRSVCVATWRRIRTASACCSPPVSGFCRPHRPRWGG